jgi:Holliday junction resolvase RusA-like endonuclease
MIKPTSKKEAPDFVAEISGRPVVKKNTQRIVGFGKKRRAIYSKLFLAYRTRALFAFKQSLVGQGSILSGGLHASYVFHFKNRMAEPDVSNLIEAPQDCLAEAGVIENDKQIMSLDAEKIISGEEKTTIKLWRL